jgi:hypothetical protein
VRTPIYMLVISAMLLAWTTAASAASYSTGISRDQMSAYLKSMGYPAADSFEKGNGHRILKTTIDGVNFDVYFLDCTTDDAGKCGSVQFAQSWTLNSPDFELVNKWNRERRFMRAYITESKSVLWAEYDFFMAPGGSTGMLDRNLDMLRALTKSLKTHFNF